MVTSMNKLTRNLLSLAIGMLFLVLPMNDSVQAESLWSDKGPAASLFSDHKAHSVGDIITIIINENSSASRTGNASNAKTSSTSMNAGTGIFAWIAAASAGNSDSFAAKGSLANTNTVTGKITVQVTEIKPNGNLAVSGTQSIKQNGEEQRIVISGVVREDDIAFDNTILSSYVSDAQLRIDGHGPIAGKQRQGILSQIFNFLF